MLKRSSTVFHLCVYGPGVSGMYESVKDLILAERKAGLSASFIDTGDGECEGVTDVLSSIPVSQFRNADILAWHHKISHDIINVSKNVLFIHGNPETTFYKGFREDDNIYDMYYKLGKNPRFYKFFYMWKRHGEFWKEFFPEDKLVHVPIWYDYKRVKYNVKRQQGKPFVLGLCDFWRYGKEMFYLLHALPLIKKMVNYPMEIKIVGANETCARPSWLMLTENLMERGVVNSLESIVPELNQNIGDMFDMILTQTPDESRVVREALGAGVPVFCGDTAAKYTKFKAQSTDVKHFAQKVSKLINNFIDQKGYWQVERRRGRKYALKQFDITKSIDVLKKHFDDIMNN